MLNWIQNQYQEQISLLEQAEKLAKQQDQQLQNISPSLSTSSTSSSSASSSSTSETNSLLHNPDTSSHSSSWYIRIIGDWNKDDIQRILHEFSYMPFYVIPASICSFIQALSEIGKGIALGHLTDTFTTNSTLLHYISSSPASSCSPGIVTSNTTNPTDPATCSFSSSSTSSSSTSSLWEILWEWREGFIALLFLLLINIIEWISSIGKDYLFAQAKAERMLYSRSYYMGSILRQDLVFHDQYRSGELSERIQKDPDAIDDVVLYTFERLFKGILALITIGIMVYTDWQLTFISILLRIPFFLQFIEASVRIESAYDRLSRSALEKAQSRAVEMISNVRSIQAVSAEGLETRNYATALYHYLYIQKVSAFARALMHHAEGVILIFTQIILLSFGAYRIRTGQSTFGTFQQYTAIANTFINNFHGLEAVYNSIRTTAITSRRYFSLRNREPSIPLQLPNVNAIVDELLHSKNNIDNTIGIPNSTNMPDLPIVSSVPSIESTVSTERKRRLSLSHLSKKSTTPTSSTITKSTDESLVSVPTNSLSIVSGSSLRNMMKGQIRFNHISFRYQTYKQSISNTTIASTFTSAPSATTLRDITFTVEPGEVVALVGPSGAGKSTIAALLLRYFDPIEGSIELDNIDIRNFDTHSYRSLLGTVDQDTTLLDRTIYENICLGFDPYDKDNYPTYNQVWEAVKKANADEFIQKLPDGLNTFVGEKGSRLSGGQRQRIAIARAIIRNPLILLLDEATSALDSESEAAVTQALSNLMKNRTTIIIAHRLSTIRHAHKIIVLNMGSIVESGSHQELLKEYPNGLYNRLLTLQQQQSSSSNVSKSYSPKTTTDYEETTNNLIIPEPLRYSSPSTSTTHTIRTTPINRTNMNNNTRIRNRPNYL